MAAGPKRMTFAIAPEMEDSLNSIKKEFFYACSRSEMIRELVSAGVRAMRAEKAEKEQEPVKAG